MNIQTTIDYVSESISLLCHMGRQKTYRTYCEDMARRLCPNPSALFSAQKDIMIFLEKAEKQIQLEFQDGWEELLYYFAPISDKDHSDCLGRLLLLWKGNHHAKPESFDAFSSRLLEMTDETYHRDFSIEIQRFCETGKDSSHFLSLEEPKALLSYILNLNFSKAICLKLEDGLLHYRKHLTKLLDYISRTIAVIQVYEEEMYGFIHAMENYWSNLQDRDLEKSLKKYLAGISDDSQKLVQHPCGLIIKPEIFLPFCMEVPAKTDRAYERYPDSLVIAAGILYCEACPVDFRGSSRTDSQKEEYYLNIVKQLSDKNRFEILTLIKDTPAFGNELASHLNLTTATISHHMNQLMGSNLADARQHGTRMYYHSNQTAIKDCFDYIKKELHL